MSLKRWNYILQWLIQIDTYSWIFKLFPNYNQFCKEHIFSHILLIFMIISLCCNYRKESHSSEDITMKVKVLVTQLCLTLCEPLIDCSPPCSPVHGDSPGKTTGVGCYSLLQGIFLTQGSNPGLLHCRGVIYHLSHQERAHVFLKYSAKSSY